MGGHLVLPVERVDLAARIHPERQRGAGRRRRAARLDVVVVARGEQGGADEAETQRFREAMNLHDDPPDDCDCYRHARIGGMLRPLCGIAGILQMPVLIVV
jgi:hypothetical protein